MRLVYGDADGLQRSIDRHGATRDRLTETLNALSTRVVVLEHQVTTIRKTMEENRRRLWATLTWFSAGLLGGFITVFFHQLLLYLLRKP